MVEVGESLMEKLCVPTWGLSFILSFTMKWILKFWLCNTNGVLLKWVYVSHKKIFTRASFHRPFWFALWIWIKSSSNCILICGTFYRNECNWGEDNPSALPLSMISCYLQCVCCHIHPVLQVVDMCPDHLASWYSGIQCLLEPSAPFTSHEIPDPMALRIKVCFLVVLLIHIQVVEFSKSGKR